MTHTWTQPEAADAGPNQTAGNPLAVTGETRGSRSASPRPGRQRHGSPTEAAAAELAHGQRCLHPAGRARDAALPVRRADRRAARHGHRGIGRCSAASPQPTRSAGARRTRCQHGPVRLGAGRIVPVRVTGADRHRTPLRQATLNPTHAEVQLHTAGAHRRRAQPVDNDALAKLARAANAYSQGLRQALAVANLGQRGRLRSSACSQSEVAPCSPRTAGTPTRAPTR